ncbi:3'(2'),5'-bisphosphate nucleotidase CysQ [soil metagenome]
MPPERVSSSRHGLLRPDVAPWSPHRAVGSDQLEAYELEAYEHAGQIADAAGACLLALRDRLADGEDPWILRDRADTVANKVILSELAARSPGVPVLSEESPDDPRRLATDQVWIVDPLDGTREWGEEGRDDWAVHVALVEAGTPVAGAVALPARGLTFTSGAVRPPAGRVPARPRVMVSRTRPPRSVAPVRAAIDGVLVPMGSAGAKAMAVVLGEAELYLHAGGQYEWDSAAPVAVALAAGLHASRLDGSPLVYNQPDPWLPDLLICRVELADRVLDTLARVGRARH